jgi:hypothetical protein
MAQEGVPRSFQELKQRAAEKVRRGDPNVEDDIVAMGDAMLQNGVEPKNAEDRVAKRLWQSSQPHEKRMLAGMVARMAKDEAESDIT